MHREPDHEPQCFSDFSRLGQSVKMANAHKAAPFLTSPTNCL